MVNVECIVFMAKPDYILASQLMNPFGKWKIMAWCFIFRKDSSIEFQWRCQWCRDDWNRRTAIFKRHILSSFQKTTKRLNCPNIYYITIIHILYLISKIHEQYLKFLLSVDFIYHPILFYTEIIYRRTLMRDRDGGSRAHSLHTSI